MPSSSQKMMAILIKFFELKYTIDFFQQGNRLFSIANSLNSSDPMEMMSSLKEIFPKDQQDTFDNMLQIFQAMEMFQSFQGDDTLSNLFGGDFSEQNPQDLFQMFSKASSDSKPLSFEQ